jgi:hypothetical protein
MSAVGGATASASSILGRALQAALIVLEGLSIETGALPATEAVTLSCGTQVTLTLRPAVPAAAAAKEEDLADTPAPAAFGDRCYVVWSCPAEPTLEGIYIHGWQSFCSALPGNKLIGSGACDGKRFGEWSSAVAYFLKRRAEKGLPLTRPVAR